jgi:PilZ domain
MSRARRADDRRISGRVEEILTGWWKLPDSKFERCKTLDLSMDGALIVLDQKVEDNATLEVHLDMEADWSVALDAEILWQRPIFFGRQQLTAVTYRFRKPEDHSMFGLWIQRRLREEKGSSEQHLKPVVLSDPKPEVQPSIEPAPTLNLLESRWKKTFSQLTAKIPWTESEPLPHERRAEARGQVGLTVGLETEFGRMKAEFLNVSLSGACIFIPRGEEDDSRLFLSSGPISKLEPGQRVELVLPEGNLLLGGSRCKANAKWLQRAELKGSKDVSGLVMGVTFSDRPSITKRTFVGDLLRRLNYNVRQNRSELRFPRELPVIVKFEDNDRVRGKTLDISAGGARVLLKGEFSTPRNVTVQLELGEKKDVVNRLTLSSRLLRRTVDKDGRNCYAVAFRKGQTQEHLELSRWLAKQLPVQGLSELVPNFSKSPLDNDV